MIIRVKNDKNCVIERIKSIVNLCKKNIKYCRSVCL